MATATAAALGDTLVGFYEPLCDRDFFALDIPAGTRINFEGGPAYITVLKNADTVIAWQIGGQPPPRDVSIVNAGRYYFSISFPFHEEPVCKPATPESAYRIRVVGVADPLGPADPPAPAFARLGGWVARVTPGQSSELWGHANGGAVARINMDGSIHVLLDRLSDVETSGPYGAPYTMDAMGDLLVAGTVRRSIDGHDSSIVWRVNPQTGVVTVFTSGLFYWSRLKLAVAPNGDVWMGPGWRWGNNNSSGGRTFVWRFDPLGSLLDSVEISPLRPEPFHALSVSPTGDPYLGGYHGVHRIINGTLEHVIPRDSGDVKSLAFDRDGYLYVVKGNTNADHRVALYDPSFRLIDDTLAHLPFSAFAYQLLFASDQAGNQGGRLLALGLNTARPQQFVELNPAGVRAPGFRLRPLLPIALPGDSTALAGYAYSSNLRMSDAPGPIHWSHVTGRLPPGVTLSETTGELSGVPTSAGAYTFSIRARSGERYGFARFTIVVAPLTFTVDDAINAVLGGPALSPANAQFLDEHGNRNGMLDVGDIRALLRAQGLLQN